MTNKQAPTAILSALADEQAGLIEQLQHARSVLHAGRQFWCGVLHDQPVVLALSRIGKVAAATTAAALIEKFAAARVVFTGVAGGVDPSVQVGDMVLAKSFVQHDMNAYPLFPRFEIPLTGQTVLPTDAELTSLLDTACRAALLDGLNECPNITIHQGLIASGDQFINSAAHAATIVQSLQDYGHATLAVEMEGAAVAQVCADYGIPFAAVRTISDRADATAHVDFPKFVTEVASVYAQKIIVHLLQSL